MMMLFQMHFDLMWHHSKLHFDFGHSHKKKHTTVAIKMK